MIQNHMFQMLAYLCMEPPSSFARRRHPQREGQAARRRPRLHARGGAAEHACAASTAPARRPTARPAPAIARSPTSTRSPNTETFAAMKLFIDNWRWDGVPIYLRSGKALWKRGTEIVVQFKKAPRRHLPRHAGRQARRPTGSSSTSSPTRGSRSLFQAKTPGPGDAAPAGQHALQLRRGVRGVARHRLRGDDLQLHDRRRDAVLAHRPGRDRLAHRPADPRRLGRPMPARIPQLPRRHLGTTRRLRTDRARRPTLVRDHQPRDTGARAALPGRRCAVPQSDQHGPAARGPRRRAKRSSRRTSPATRCS